MTTYFEAFDVDETTPVQYAGVYITRWEQRWGEPTILFREIDFDKQSRLDNLQNLMQMSRSLVCAIEKKYGPNIPDDFKQTTIALDYMLDLMEYEDDSA